MKRFISLDILRGNAIIIVIFMHALLYNSSLVLGELDPEANIVTQIISYFLYWAPAFAMISGTANTISIYGRFRAKKMSAKKMLNNLLLTGFEILIMNYIYMLFFTPGHVEPGLTSIGILPGLVRYGVIFISSLERLIFSTTLVMLGTSTITLGIVLYLIFRKEPVNSPTTEGIIENNVKVNNRNYIIMGLIATGILVLYPLVEFIATPILSLEVNPLNFLFISIISWIAGDLNPMFPYASFALFGGLIGMMVIDNQPRKKILKFGFGAGGIITIIGLIFYSFLGFNPVPYQTPPLHSMILLLGPILFLFTLLFYRNDLRGDKAKMKAFKHSRFSRRCSMISLSIFMLESTISYGIGHIIDFIYPAWRSDAIVLIFIFAPLMLVIWFVILRLWGRVQFKGSFEWLFLQIAAKLTKKESIRLDEKLILFNPEIYIERV
jgi:hypothetical protein